MTEQVFYASKDGTRVPMFITRRKDARLDGTNPTLLYGYGGFNIAQTADLQRAGRGLARAWAASTRSPTCAAAASTARTGTRPARELSKQNVFDDFIAAAEWLIDEKIHVAAEARDPRAQQRRAAGRRVLTQRPELFGAALPARRRAWTCCAITRASANAYAWSSDYGTAEDPEQFRALLAYSPLHNLQGRRCYPPTLVTTADHDDRVVPWHSFKFAAALQDAQACANPVLIRIETRAGHGAGKPTWMQIEDCADQWAFLVKALGMPGGS